MVTAVEGEVQRLGSYAPSILIVDDFEPNLLALEAVLSPLGYLLTRATSGETALKHVLQQDFALILLDVMMPGIDGYQTAALIRQRARSRDIPIVFLTAMSTSPSELMKGYAHGGADYLVKPYDPDILRAKVQVFVELHRSREEIRRQAELLQLHERERQKMRTEVREAVQARGQAEHREAAYRFLAESIPQQVWASGPDGALDYVSPVVERYFGEPAAAILGAGWLAVVHPGDAQRCVELWTRALASGESYEIEFRLRRHDGQYRWHLARAVPERGATGAIIRWFGTNTDIDERRAMELELRTSEAALLEALARVAASERRFQALAESMPQIMWSMSPDGIEAYLNARWYAYTGQPEALPVDEKWRRALHPDDHESCFATWADARTKNAAWEMEYRIRRHDGAFRWHLGRSVPELAPDGGAIQWYGTATDIHEQKMAIRSRDDLLATVSHDLRNSLGTISLAADLMQNAAEPNRNATSIQRAAGRMEQLLRDLLDISTIESGHLSIVLEPCDVDGLMSEASQMVSERATAKGVDLTTLHAPVGATVRCDKHRILQVFANLLGNAIKFTSAGGKIMISARTDAHTVTFAVKDTGQGIKPEQLDYVFDRFWKAKDTAKAGTGLGLAICHGIVEQHGGSIWVESAMGIGTTFHFTIPLG